MKWCKKHYGCKTLAECRAYADEWLSTRLVLSPYTQKLEACTSGYRTIPLTEKSQKILEDVERISPDSEYLFTQADGERMTSRSFNYWLEKYCRDAGITFKSSHCIRRTFASRLFAAGMPLAEISVYMGHEDIETTKGYIYNYYEIEQNRSYMNKAL